MTDDRVETHVKIEDGSIIHFEEYFVKRRCEEVPVAFYYQGAESASPTEEAVEAIRTSDLIVITPSNPIASIEPILSIPGYREEITQAKCPILGVSPLVGGKALKGPAEEFMKAKGFQSNALGVAEYYSDLLSHFVIDKVDLIHKEAIEALGLSVSVTNTIMTTRHEKVALAEHIIETVEK
jgi:LPPG:FO 2-phospho-L-lactate transferase